MLEADIKGFFDNVNHDWMMKFLEHDIADKNFLRYIKRFLIAGVMDGTEKKESDKGTPQGDKCPRCWQMYTCTTHWTCGMKKSYASSARERYIMCGTPMTF